MEFPGESAPLSYSIIPICCLLTVISDVKCSNISRHGVADVMSPGYPNPKKDIPSGLVTSSSPWPPQSSRRQSRPPGRW